MNEQNKEKGRSGRVHTNNVIIVTLENRGTSRKRRVTCKDAAMEYTVNVGTNECNDFFIVYHKEINKAV